MCRCLNAKRKGLMDFRTILRVWTFVSLKDSVLAIQVFILTSVFLLHSCKLSSTGCFLSCHDNSFWLATQPHYFEFVFLYFGKFLYPCHEKRKDFYVLELHGLVQYAFEWSVQSIQQRHPGCSFWAHNSALDQLTLGKPFLWLLLAPEPLADPFLIICRKAWEKLFWGHRSLCERAFGHY